MDSSVLAAIVVLAVTGVIFGMTGFGFALVSVPPLLLLFAPETVVVVTLSVGLLTSILVVSSSWRVIDIGVVKAVVPGAVAGLLLGAQLLGLVDPTLLKVVAGILIAGYALLMLRGHQLTGLGSSWAATWAGVASGALNTSTGLAGPPIVMLLTARQLPRDVFRVTMAAYFIVINLTGLTILVGGGMVGEREGLLTMYLTPAAALGVLVGNRLAHRLTADTFRVLTMVLLLATGLMGIGTAMIAVW